MVKSIKSSRSRRSAKASAAKASAAKAPAAKAPPARAKSRAPKQKPAAMTAPKRKPGAQPAKSKAPVPGRSKAPAPGKWVYAFGGGRAEGEAGLRDLLGGKGANLAEMANLGLPVPPGFTITTEVCTYFYRHGKSYPKELGGPGRGGARSRSARSPAGGSATATIRCWSRCARARARPCRA